MIRRVPLYMVGMGLAALLVVGADVGFLQWATHPNLIKPVGDQESFPLAVGHSAVEDTGVASLRGEDDVIDTTKPGSKKDTYVDHSTLHGYHVTIKSITPNIVENTSHATIRLELCTRNSFHLRIRGDGSQEYDFYCPSYEPLAHQTVKLSDAPRASQLAAVITPHQPGAVKINGFRVSYRHGVRRQTQNGGIVIVVHTPTK